MNSIKLETLKTYTKTYLKIRFIWPFKSSVGVPILFDKNSDSNYCLSIDYQGFNNLTIKNWYFIPLIKKVLDYLSQAK